MSTPTSKEYLEAWRTSQAENQALRDKVVTLKAELKTAQAFSHWVVIERDKLRVELDALKAHIKFQSGEACEGMCTEGDGGQGRFEDCQGCDIYKVLLESNDG